jgi:hypothetical protein
MKKTVSTFVILFASASFLLSQNLQLHYDFRHSLDRKNPIQRNFFVATFEMYEPDKLGSTFMFVDFEFSKERGNLNGVYTEIARAFKINDFPFQPHIEFNGGVGFGFVVENAYLAGLAYPFKCGNFFFNTYLAYKYHNFAKASHDAQLTFVWDGNILNNKVTIRGFADLWSVNRSDNGETGKKNVFYSEPQFWYNINKHFAIGTEIKLAYNFHWWASNFKAYPTLGVKCNLR